jgi:Ca2+-binding RTX toxin-like protein
VAIADQGRALAGEQSLDGANDLLPMLYSLPDSDFHKFSATQYNMGAGLGTPIADKLIPDLVSAPATLVDGLLSVTGAAGNDTITVSSGGGIITVNVNGNSSTFNDSQVSSLSINSLGGNDQITVNESGLAAPIDATIRVGAGNNVITAGNGNNVIRAGLGADNIKVGGGSDIVVALGTSSTIAGGTGNDTLVAANHASVSGGGGEDFIWGTNGHDTLIGNVGSLTGTDMIYTSGAKGDNVQPGSNDQLNPNGRKRPANNAAYLLNLESLTQVP